MISNKNWIPFPSRQSIGQIFWNKNDESEQPCYVVSRSIDKRFGLKPGKTVKFSKVESYIDKFVEEKVPLFVDQLYEFCNEYDVQQSSSKDILIPSADIHTSVKKMKKKLNKIDKLRTVIESQDQDDFDLRVASAKYKISSAIEYFFESTNYKPPAHAPLQSPSSRTHKAKDLLSYLPHDESIDSDYGEYSGTNDNDEQLYATYECNKSSLEQIEHINKDIANLLKIMEELHVLVCKQEEVVDSIEDHIENAGDHVVEGNQKLKKVTILKAAMFPVVGAVVGGVVGGPIGLFAGMKVGSMAGGVAMAGLAGSVAGYQGGKILKKKSDKDES